jgi:membrane-associated protease RseP (regulator of RpoE activity)
MSKRTTIIVIISIAVILVIGLVMVSTAALAYVAFQARPDTLVHQEDSTFYNENDGIVLASVEPGSSAEQAGLVRGDILLEIDNMDINSFSDLVIFLEGYHGGDQIELKVLHGDELRNIKATLDERDGRAYLGVTSCGGPRERLPIFEQPIANGIIITEVIADSPAE